VPKRIHQIKDFSGGLNELQDAADIRDNQLSHVQNLMFNIHGSIGPAYLMSDTTEAGPSGSGNLLTRVTYSNPYITSTTSGESVQPGYGLGYFEVDWVRDPVTVLVATADQSGGSEDGFKVLTSQTELNLTVNGSGVNLSTSFEVGSQILLTAPAFPANSIDPNGQGIYKVVAHNGNNLILDRSVAISLETGQVYWAATVKGFAFGDKIILMANPKEHTIDSFSFNTGFGGVATVDDTTPTPSSAWQASQSHTSTAQTSTDGSGSSISCNIATDGSGNPTFTIVDGGTGYVVDEEITFTDPGSTSNTAVLVVATLTKWNKNSITLRSSETGIDSKVKYYKSGEAIRCCDTADLGDSKIQWYGHIQRRHFPDAGSTTDDNSYSAYYAKDNDLAPPTENDLTSASTASPANFTTYPASAGTGFEFNIITHTDVDGAIPGAVYECASTFIYDGNQESLPLVYANTHDSTSNDLKALSLNVSAKGPYDPRISGGRIYIREQGTDSEWIMLLDLDLTKGGRTKLSDDYTTWFDADSSTYNCPTATASANFEVLELGLVTYEVINGYSSSIFSNAIGDQGEYWKDATVSNDRVFVCNVTIKDETKGPSKSESTTTNFPDRILYSMPGRYDTFPYHNYIEAAKGDADHYIAIDSFADRLLAFKQYSLDIINISGDDYNWFLENSYKYQGVMHPEAVKRTQYGIVWANLQGLFLYDGSQIRNLSEKLISDSTWSRKITNDTSIIYDEQESMVFVISDMGGDGSTYMCDLKNNSFTFIESFVPVANDGITNSVDTEDNNTIIAHDEGDTIDFYQLRRSAIAQVQTEFRTKQTDFGDPSTSKKVYAVYITYKTDSALTGYFTLKEDDGTSHALSGTVATASDWATVKLTPTSPITCNKILLQMDTATNSRKVYINDIGIEYRVLHKRAA